MNLAGRARLADALRGRADTLTHCPQCGERARFLYAKADNGHEVAGWIYEQPILNCPKAPTDRFVTVRGALLVLDVATVAEDRQKPSPEEKSE